MTIFTSLLKRQVHLNPTTLYPFANTPCFKVIYVRLRIIAQVLHLHIHTHSTDYS
jgi:hypothetical protein